MRITKRKIAVVVSATAVVALGAGAAFAYFTTTGTGSGTAAAGSGTTVTVLQTNAAITGLYPGGPSAALSGAFDNSATGATAVQVGAVTVTSVTVDTGHPLCDPVTANIVIGGADVGPHSLGIGSSVGSWSGLTIQMANLAATDQSACKGATFTVHYAV